jgi:hypothetical protein
VKAEAHAVIAQEQSATVPGLGFDVTIGTDDVIESYRFH